VHGQKKAVGDLFKLRVARLGLRPVGRLVEIIDRAVDIVDIALGQKGDALGHPALDGRHISLGQRIVALRFDLAIPDIDHRDLGHLDPALAVLRIHAENRRAVVAHPEIIVGQVCRHGLPT
jgi:hypothetical protein